MIGPSWYPEQARTKRAAPYSGDMNEPRLGIPGMSHGFNPTGGMPGNRFGNFSAPGLQPDMGMPGMSQGLPALGYGGNTGIAGGMFGRSGMNSGIGPNPQALQEMLARIRGMR